MIIGFHYQYHAAFQIERTMIYFGQTRQNLTYCKCQSFYRINVHATAIINPVL